MKQTWTAGRNNHSQLAKVSRFA